MWKCFLKLLSVIIVILFLNICIFFSKNKLLYCKLLAVGNREIEGYLNLFLFVFIIRIVIKILQINLKPLVKCKRIFSTLQYGKHTAYTHSFSVQLDHQLEI